MNAFTVTTPAQPVASVSDLVTSPQRVRTDEGTVEERPLPDVIQADVYNRLDQPNATVQKPLWGIAVASVRPPDTLGGQNRDLWTPRSL